MILVDKQLPSLTNGVSQQPATQRLPSQAEAQVNAYGTVVDGLRKRPPTEHVARLSPLDLSAAHLHKINRDTVERYEVVLTDGDLKVYDLSGTEKTVTFPHGKAYLDVVAAKTDFAVVTVADYSFIVNKTVTVALEDSAADHTADPGTYWWLNREFIGGDTYGARQRQYAVNPSGVTYKGVKQSFQELPETPAAGDLWEIQGTEESGFTRYFVVRQGAVWNETVKPGLKNKFDATTMPHALVRKADGTFEFGPFSWNPRRVGDETTNPNPTFVGRQIKDVFFSDNRLGFAVDENVVRSRVGDFGTFHRLTTMDKLSDEVEDIAATDVQVTKFNYVVPFDKTMMLFSGQVQFQLLSDGALTGKKALKPATRYETVEAARPLALGSDVYMASESDNWAKVYEYFVRENAVSNEAGDITAHVPRYIPAGVTKLTGSSTLDLVLVLTDGAPNHVYSYKFYWANENEKAQSAWSHWTFGASDNILTADVLDDYVYYVIARDYGTFLERQPLDSGAVAPGLPFQIYLDRRATVTGTYIPLATKTEFVLPYSVPEDDRANFRIVRGAGFSTAAGALVSLDPDDYEWTAEDTVRVPGDVGTASCLCGINYAKRYTFSKQYMKNQQDVPIVTGRLVLRTFTVAFLDTAYFKTEVAPYGVDAATEEVVPSRFTEFDGKTVGTADLIIGTPVFASGSYSFTVGGEASIASVTLVNDTPYNSTFQSAEWEGSFHKRSRTI